MTHLADIALDIYNIQNAARGETVRDSVVDALKKFQNDLNPPRMVFKAKNSIFVTKDGKSVLVLKG